jgi:NOT2 / NOT3 / NOT5 family
MSFVSPWGDGPSRVDTLLPTCYRLNGSSTTSPASLLPRLRQLSEETLFFMVYHSSSANNSTFPTTETRSTPAQQQHSDLTDASPSQQQPFSFLSDFQKHIGGELCRRGWRYQRSLQLWVQKGMLSLDSGTMSSSNPTQQPPQIPCWYVFDAVRWEKSHKDFSSFIDSDFHDPTIFSSFPFDHLVVDSTSLKEVPDGPVPPL